MQKWIKNSKIKISNDIASTANQNILIKETQQDIIYTGFISITSDSENVQNLIQDKSDVVPIGSRKITIIPSGNINYAVNRNAEISSDSLIMQKGYFYTFSFLKDTNLNLVSISPTNADIIIEGIRN